jgi:hypothetical protein
MKKVLAAALLCAVSSFATWDYFPIKPAGKGEVKVGYEFDINHEGDENQNASGINAGARFSVIEGLEIVTQWQFPMTWTPGKDIECKDLKDANLVKECPPTFAQPIVGLRYWLPMGLGIALDVALPFQGDAMGGGDAANLAFRPAVQYSTNFTPELSLGSEVGLAIGLENGEDYTPGMNLGLGVELDYSLGMAVPFIGVDVGLGLTKPKYNGNEGEADKAAIDLNIGSIFNINETFSADAGVTLGFGEGNTGKDGKMPIAIYADFSLNF